MTRASELRLDALRLRDAQATEAAYAAIKAARALAPDDASIAFIAAQLAFETGRAAVQLFERAHRLDPGNLPLIRNWAAALAADGNETAAISLIKGRLVDHPDWIEGHKLITSLRLADGADTNHMRSYATACAAQPRNIALWMAWFQTQSLAHNWDEALAILDDAERFNGSRQAFTLARLFVTSESGDAAHNAHLFDAVADVRDPGLDLCQVRHWIRLGDPARAMTVAQRHIGAPSANAFWPYLSLIWRLTGNAKAQWLDRPEALIKSYDLALAPAELETLAQMLGTLHRPQRRFLEQSVRGGTQTDGPLLFHHSEPIRQVRAAITQAVADYANALPPLDREHPMFAPRGKEIAFAGSWSVRLAAQGHHVCHTHPMGWISSAFYVLVPPPAQCGLPPAGWIEFGKPPPELGLDLPAYTRVKPIAGRLVLFPSTMWHGTMPFSDGERLTIAFDVRRPIAT